MNVLDAFAAFEKHGNKMTPKKSSVNNQATNTQNTSTQTAQKDVKDSPKKSNVDAAFAAFEKHGNKMTPKKNNDNNQNVSDQKDTQNLSQKEESSTAVNPTQTKVQETKMPEDTKVEKVEFLPVDINIAGTPHRITCPANEINALEDSVSQINNQIRSIRQGIKNKSLTNEELLVLTCLELCDQIRSLKEVSASQDEEKDHAMVLIAKMIKDAKSAL